MLNLKGTALCGLGKYKEALACFEQALPLSQGGTALQRSILFNRIAAVENLRDFKRAKELAAEYSDKYPNDERMNRENQFLQSR
jgi:tetratricopeptide (TPR) repeat protein